MDVTSKSEDHRQRLIYDPAVGVTLAWTPVEAASETQTEEEAAERARRLEMLASGAWIFLSDP